MNQRIFISGLGLIGSSLALCIKKSHPNVTIIGYDTNEISEQFALKRHIIDQKATSFEQAAEQAEVIFLCSPVNNLLQQLEILSRLTLRKEVIISDVGSTKMKIVSTAKQLNLNSFIGGHPMAGSHKSGVTAADENLFENAYYILSCTDDKLTTKRQLLQQLLVGTRAKFVILSPEEHDQITAMLSHLPHVIAAALVNQSQVFNQSHPRANQLAAGGFRDITRIASSDPQMWTDILLSNKESLLTLIDQWQHEMVEIATCIKNEDEEAIYDFFNRAKETRNQMPIHKKGAIPAFYDLFVDIPDESGVIAQITGILSEERLSLVNIKIIETREDIHGILQLSFKKAEDLIKAKTCLEQVTDYACYEK